MKRTTPPVIAATPRRAALDLIARYGATVNDMSGYGELIADVWSPPGVVWAATGQHLIAVSQRNGRPEGWLQLAADLSQGTRPCTRPLCEGCKP